jgi:oligopeptidase B
MKTKMPALLVLGCVMALGCAAPDDQGDSKVSMNPPIATKQAHEIEAHGDVRVDDYYLLRERDNPDVIAYL